MNIHFILVEPAIPENIGAAARAIKTMGFTSLWIVNSKQYLQDEARYLAHGSGDVLDNIQYFDSFNEMISKLEFSIATTAKTRSVKQEYLNGEEIPGFLQEKSNIINNAGIIFGREEYGLKNEELKRCDVVSSLPMSTTYPSLNLGQAVMLYAYILSGLNINQTSSVENKSGNKAELEALKKKVELLLPLLDMDRNTNIYGRIFERIMRATENDIHLLHSIANKIQKKLKSTQNPK
jgi:tRNA/rRNA methyltransferase